MASLERSKDPTDILTEAELQWIYTEEELVRTPSIIAGMSPQDEKQMRSKGVNFIIQVGVMLKLPQTTVSTASVFFNRFLMRYSLVGTNDVKALHHYVSGRRLPLHCTSPQKLTFPVSKLQLLPYSLRPKLKSTHGSSKNLSSHAVGLHKRIQIFWSTSKRKTTGDGETQSCLTKMCYSISSVSILHSNHPTNCSMI
jgi:hypothetical protein